jgi:hypothetical protein
MQTAAKHLRRRARDGLKYLAVQGCVQTALGPSPTLRCGMLKHLAVQGYVQTIEPGERGSQVGWNT